MPLYLYKHPEDEDMVVEVFQGMNEEHSYFGEDGLKWLRIFTRPQMAMDTKIDPFSQKDFVKKTQNKGTVGDLMDRSQEMSDMRAAKIGTADPIKQKAEKRFYKKA